jgi:hypothetical protein
MRLTLVELDNEMSDDLSAGNGEDNLDKSEVESGDDLKQLIQGKHTKLRLRDEVRIW